MTSLWDLDWDLCGVLSKNQQYCWIWLMISGGFIIIVCLSSLIFLKGFIKLIISLSKYFQKLFFTKFLFFLSWYRVCGFGMINSIGERYLLQYINIDGVHLCSLFYLWFYLYICCLYSCHHSLDLQFLAQEKGGSQLKQPRCDNWRMYGHW